MVSLSVQSSLARRPLYRDSATRFLTSSFLHGSVSPKPLIIPFGPFQIFSIQFYQFAGIFAAQGAPLVSSTQMANGKHFQSEKFFFLHLWVVELAVSSWPRNAHCETNWHEHDIPYSCSHLGLGCKLVAVSVPSSVPLCGSTQTAGDSSNHVVS